MLIACDACGLESKKRRSRARKFNFCGKRCQDSPEARAAGYTTGPSATTGTGKGNGYRKKALDKYGRICRLCGYDLVVQVDHVDGDHHNNAIENLQVLCPNHHWEKTLGIGNFALVV